MVTLENAAPCAVLITNMATAKAFATIVFCRARSELTMAAIVIPAVAASAGASGDM